MGYASLNNNGAWQNCSSGANFMFRKRQERIDWRKIASLDVERISRDLDFDSLQENIANVAFCNIECELDSRCVDPNYVKLFKLAQLIIEYLLHSQDYLSHTVVALEEKCKYLTCELDKEKKGKESLECTIKSLKDEIKKYKKMICTQQQNQPCPPSECHSCPFCPKIFLTTEYLQMHVKRRHIDCVTSEPKTQVPCIVEKLEKELNELKERLKSTECQLQEERQFKKSDEIIEEIQTWKRQQLECQKREIEAIRDLFMKEMRELSDRTTFAEHCVSSLQRELEEVCTSPPVTPAPPCQIPAPPCQIPVPVPIYKPCDDSAEALKGQKKEFCKLKKHLAQHVEDVVCRHLKDQEDMLQSKIKCLVKEQNHELEKLNCLVRDKFNKPETNLAQTECLLQNLCERTKEQEKQLKKQQKKIQELMCKPPIPKICRDESPKEKTTDNCIDKRMQRLEDKYDEKRDPDCCKRELPCCKHKKQSDSNSVDTSCVSPKTAQYSEAMRRNRSLVRGLRNELSCMLHEKLENLGIGVSEKSSVEEEIISNILKKYGLDKVEANKESPKPKKVSGNKKEDKHSRSKSWPSDSSSYDDDDYEEDDKEDFKRKTKYDGTKENLRDKRLTRSPSLPNTLSLSQNADEGKKKIKKQSRFSNTKDSFTKLVTSVKKKLKPRKFWNSVPHSTPILLESKKEENLKIIRQNSEPVIPAALNQSEYKTESEESDDDDDEEEEDDDDDDEEEEEEDKIGNGDANISKDYNKSGDFKEESRISRIQNEVVEVHEPPEDESSSDWGSPNESAEAKENPTPQLSARLFTVLPQKPNKMSTKDLVEKIESKLVDPRKKPFGGIDTIDSRNKPKNSMQPSSDFDDSSSDEDDLIDKNSKKLESKNVEMRGKTSKGEITSVQKISSWPSDEDVSEIS